MTLDATNDSISPNYSKPVDRSIMHSLALLATAFYIGLYIIRPWEVLFPSWGALHIERLYALFMVICVALSCGIHWRWNVQNTAVAAFTFAVGTASAFAVNRSLAWDTFYIFLTLIVCYWTLISVVRCLRDLVFILCAYIAFMELYLIKALWEYYIYGRHLNQQDVTRLIGIDLTYGNHNAVAASIVMSLPIWLFLWRHRQILLSQYPALLKKWIVGGLGLYSLLGAFSIILTNSRTGMINLGVFVLLSSIQNRTAIKVARNLILAALVLLSVWFILPEEQQFRLETIWDPTVNESAELSKQGRIDGFYAAIQMFRHFPITGVGPGNFISYRVDKIDGVGLDPHNLPGQLLAETGLLGAVTFAFLIFALLANKRKTVLAKLGHLSGDLRVLPDLARACRDSMILLFVDGITTHNLFRYNWLWLAAFCSLAAGLATEFDAAENPECTLPEL